MAYEDLVTLDERTEITTIPFEGVDFNIRETGDGDRLFARFDGFEVQVRKNPRHFETICQAFGVPFKFAESVPQGLLQDIFTVLGEQKRGIPQNWAIDTTDQELVAHGDTRKPYVPFTRIGDIFHSNGFVDLDGSMGRNGIGEITATHPERSFVEPRVGDITRSGVNYRGNPLMDEPPSVLPWSLRLWCTNGMTSLQERERVHVVGHDVDEVLEQINYQANKAFEYAERINHRFADMVAHEVNPVEGMNNLIASHRIPVRMQRNLLDQVAVLPEDQHTMYDVLNVFTRFATNEFDPTRRLALQAIGGDVAVVDHLNCNMCGHQLD